MNTQILHFDTQRLNAISIAEVAQRLGDTLKRRGRLNMTTCPWHADTHPSLALYESDKENRCHCFSCKNGGSVIDYVMQRESWTFKEACQWLSSEFDIGMVDNKLYAPRPKLRPSRAAPEPPDYTYIPEEMVDALVSVENSLGRCLMQMFHPEAVEWVTELYRIGCYAMNGHDDFTVFPNIDLQGRVCNLKVQHYEANPLSPRFAHSDPGSCYWLGAMWVREGRLPQGAVFNPLCLFGEHLLCEYPSHKVVLVESPKNALFGALAHPQLLWVATGNKGMLRREVLLPLRSRDVIVIPDRDAIPEWQAEISRMGDIANFVVSDFCDRVAPEGELKFDIADYLQQSRLLPF